MPSPNHGIGVDEHVGITGGTETKNGLDDAISEATGFEFANAENYSPDVGWKAATPATEDTRVRYVLAQKRQIGAGAAAVSDMDGLDDAFRWRWDPEWVEKPSAPLVAGTTPDAGITETPSWTAVLLFRGNPNRFGAGADDFIAEARTTGGSTASTRLYQFAYGTDGKLEIRIPRMSGSNNAMVFSSAASIDDGLPHVVEISFTDTGGSGGDGAVSLDGTLIGTNSIIEIFGSGGSTGTIRLAINDNHHIGMFEHWNFALTAAQLTQNRYRFKTGAEAGLVAGLMFLEGTGTTAADVTSNAEDMTLGAGTWGTITHPRPAQNPDASVRHQAWRKRPALINVEAGAGTVATSSTLLSTTPLFCFAAWFKFPKGASAITIMTLFGNTAAESDNQFELSQTATGGLRFRPDRFSGSAPVIDSSATYDDDVWRVVSAFVTWENVASLGVNGAEVATGTAPSYTGDSTTDFHLHFGMVNFDVAGPVILSETPLSHAAAYAILRGETALIPGPSTSPGISLHYGLFEGSGTAIANAGRAGSNGDMTITSSAASFELEAITNTSTSAGLLRDSETLLSMIAWEIAPGTNPVCGEFLLELFAPETSEAPIVFSILLFDVFWPSIQNFDSGTDDNTGPRVAVGAAGGVFPDARIPRRSLGYRMPKMTLAEERFVRAAVARASQIWRQGNLVTAQPIALIDRGEDPTTWAETSEIIAAQPPRVTIVSPDHGRRIRRGLEISGPQWFPVE